MPGRNIDGCLNRKTDTVNAVPNEEDGMIAFLTNPLCDANLNLAVSRTNHSIDLREDIALSRAGAQKSAF